MEGVSCSLFFILSSLLLSDVTFLWISAGFTNCGNSVGKRGPL